MINLQLMRDPDENSAGGGDNTQAPAVPPAGNNPEPSPQPTGGTTPPAFSVPEVYRDKGWAKKVKSQDDVYKLVDNLDSVAGKKYIVPDLSKTDDPEVKAYIETLRGQTKVEDYKFSDAVPKEFSDKVGKILFDRGIPAALGNAIIAEYEKVVQADHVAMFSKEGMEKELSTVFGEDKKRSGEVINMVAALLGPEGKQFMETKIPNQFVGFMFKFMDTVKQKYGITNEGKGAEGGEGGGDGDIEKTRADLRAQIRAIDGRQHTAAEKQKLQEQLNATYK